MMNEPLFNLTAWVVASQETLLAWTALHPVAMAAGYVVAVTFGKVTPFPGGFLLMLTGGFLFGAPLGAVLSATGSAFSAVMVGAVGRRLFRGPIHRRWGHRLQKMEAKVNANAFSVILAARLFPLVPAWLINMLPVAFPIPFRHVLVATFLGLLPISFVVASLGAELSSLTQAQSLGMTDILSPSLLLPLGILALLVLTPALLSLRSAGQRGR
ncbi:TVP38/TMEM64 family protein [Ectothiorhodospira lacustris]|uniref:TVP38/TMEM64 family protein n=1 Tax=Ectothiorhodospira lacustris TaxID=2899127 RepID=UPI001EE79E90|nr:VTT domain-containing protein [Ectothiorhodospira lacustris]MCG5510280.1 VTT domain-containing protein [Ectothiorhodospira lacustris]MCG5521853.1 VTT domain-containing protein [Ectothiorhodospira lacustris]